MELAAHMTKGRIGSMKWFCRREPTPERPESGHEPCESGQAFVAHVLVMAPAVIPVALGFAVLVLTG